MRIWESVCDGRWGTKRCYTVWFQRRAEICCYFSGLRIPNTWGWGLWKVTKCSDACGVPMKCNQIARPCARFSGLCWVALLPDSQMACERTRRCLGRGFIYLHWFMFCRGCVAYWSSLSAGSHAFGIDFFLCEQWYQLCLICWALG